MGTPVLKVPRPLVKSGRRRISGGKNIIPFSCPGNRKKKMKIRSRISRLADIWFYIKSPCDIWPISKGL